MKLRNAVVTAACCLTLLGAVSQPAWGQQPPTVSLKPADSRSTDPNLGGWFVFQVEPGRTASGMARITNVADVPVRIKLYMADLVFSDSGTPSIKDGAMTDVGVWGRFDESVVVLDPNQTVDKRFTIVVPSGAEPGDHVGVVVAESEPQGQQIRIVPRVATRIYVTVPGDVTKAFEIRSIKADPDSVFMPGSALVEVILRNTGRIRLHPDVEVAGLKAEGAELLLSRSVERYVTEVDLPWYGGWVKLSVKAKAEAGLTRMVNETIFLFPWLPLALLMAVSGATMLARRWYRARGSRLAALSADIRRLETLVTHRPAMPLPAEVEEQPDVDKEAMLMATYKRLSRSGISASLPQIALALHQLSSAEAERFLADSLAHCDPETRGKVESALATYRSQPAVKSAPATRPAPPRPAPKKKKADTPPARRASRPLPVVKVTVVDDEGAPVSPGSVPGKRKGHRTAR